MNGMIIVNEAMAARSTANSPKTTTVAMAQTSDVYAQQTNDTRRQTHLKLYNHGRQAAIQLHQHPSFSVCKSVLHTTRTFRVPTTSSVIYAIDSASSKQPSI